MRPAARTRRNSRRTISRPCSAGATDEHSAGPPHATIFRVDAPCPRPAPVVNIRGRPTAHGTPGHRVRLRISGSTLREATPASRCCPGPNPCTFVPAITRRFPRCRVACRIQQLDPVRVWPPEPERIGGIHTFLCVIATARRQLRRVRMRCGAPSVRTIRGCARRRHRADDEQRHSFLECNTCQRAARFPSTMEHHGRRHAQYSESEL